MIALVFPLLCRRTQHFGLCSKGAERTVASENFQVAISKRCQHIDDEILLSVIMETPMYLLRYLP